MSAAQAILSGEAAPEAETARLRIACVVPFLNEQRHLLRFLDSLCEQERFPDQVILVDDGSSDDSPAIAEEFASAREAVQLLRRPARAPEADRLRHASELRAFHWALAHVDPGCELVGKLDADLLLCRGFFGALERAFAAEPRLGIAGAYLSVIDPRSGRAVRERGPPQHVRGATKLYRRACLRDISPVPEILGWDTIDELAARRLGWRTRSIECGREDVIHLRPTGANDGITRAQYRWGMCAYGIGQHPLWIALSAMRRLGERPPVLGSLAFLAGVAAAAVRRAPRAGSEVRAFARHEQLAELRHRALSPLGR